MIQEPKIEIIEKGDWSVGVMPSSVAALTISKSFAECLIEDGTLEKFKEEFNNLVCRFFEPEYHTEIVDDFSPKMPEP